MNVDMWCGKPLTPGLQCVLNRADGYTLLALRQKKGRVVISPCCKILGVKNQGLFINEKGSDLATLAEHLAAALNMLPTILDHLGDTDGISVQLPHLRNSQPRCQEQSEQGSIPQIRHAWN